MNITLFKNNTRKKKPKTQNIEERNLCAAKGKLQPFLTIEKTIASKCKDLFENLTTCNLNIP